MDGARRLGRLARMLSIVAIIVGLLSIIIYVVVAGMSQYKHLLHHLATIKQNRCDTLYDLQSE